jgi:hypothetical protein
MPKFVKGSNWSLELGGLFFLRVQWGIWKVETGNWKLAEK